MTPGLTKTWKTMTLCKHQPHKGIDDIWEPKYSTKDILINVEKVPKDVEHFVIQFSKESPKKVYGWFYMSGKMIRRHKKQANGSGAVYVVPLSKREDFIPLKNCEHNY